MSFQVHFLGELKTPKRDFEINCPLVIEKDFILTFYILLDKIKREGPHSISRPMAPLPPPRESSKRDARKKSLDLPGKY